MFPALVQVIESERSGRMAYFADGSVAQYDHTHDLWRPATAQIDYNTLFTRTIKRERLTDNTSIVDASFVLGGSLRATDTLDLTLSPDVSVED
jgi:hypothetical protein